ncbi:succinate--CoA ligase subunit beta [Candidatus Bathyarchaeota archaeon ex4484_205]|nr:MAG: succinate--CoA ligase subunit beta [Candidatus Bathyarchaeota archaeon ex4484_205]RLF91375.1 MAG: ADP-forming succinate--CoA ligase subunit beta [Thermococci archaeon]
MKLHEYQAKEIFAREGIPVPMGRIARNPREAFEISREIGSEVVLKAQVLVGGRGKAGGILFSSLEEVEEKSRKIFSTEIKGERPELILVEERLNSVKEFYLGITFDRSRGRPVVMTSSEGGVEIEEVARRSPEKITWVEVDPLKGIYPYMIRKLSRPFPKEVRKEAHEIIAKLYEIFVKYDAELAEINPLIYDGKKLVAADAVLNINDDSLFRQNFKREEEGIEGIASREGFSYVTLDGEIAIIGNGAGLTMATLDAVEMEGGKAANFLDIGGGVPPEGMKKALEIVYMNEKAKLVLVNVFGGINRCDEIAQGIRMFFEERGGKLDKPLVVRLTGTNEEEGRRILEEIGIEVYKDLREAVKSAVRRVKNDTSL